MDLNLYSMNAYKRLVVRCDQVKFAVSIIAEFIVIVGELLVPV